MAKGVESSSFEASDAAGLLNILLGLGSINELFDLDNLPRKLMEIERKYRLVEVGGDVDKATLQFFADFQNFISQSTSLIIEKFITFVGVDQYFIVKKGSNEFVFRYRMGANRPPELTVKFQVEKGSNLKRGEISLGMEGESPDTVRAFLAIICALGDSCELFTIEQSGNIWVIREPDGTRVEVVAYRVKDLASSDRVEGFVEIEPLNSKNVEGVIRTIKRFEQALGLSGRVCGESIADMFRPNKINKG